jgi:dienelactone hydrolase
MTAAVQGHFPERDSLVSGDEIVLLESELFELGLEPEIWHYPGVGHWFAEPGLDDFYDIDAAELAWTRMLDFLKRP